MKLRELITLAIIIIVIINSCKDNGTGPDTLEPGRRDYTWTVDTLKLLNGEFMSLYGIWGSEPNDVWACGSGSSNQYRLWHYDGIAWRNIDVGFPILDATKIYGFNKNNIWMVTATGTIAYYNGTSWKSIGNFSTQKEWLVLQGIWGKNTNDLYAFGFLDKKDLSGYTGCILRYDGRNWNYLEIEKLSLNFVTMGYDEETEKYFLSAFRSEDGMQFIFELNDNKLTKLYESNEGTKIFTMDNNIYFKIGRKIYKYSIKDGLYVWKDFTTDPIFSIVLNGRNEKDIFVSDFNNVSHFNGEGIKTLIQTDFWFNEALLFENEIFIPAKNNQTGINAVIHGKLSN